MDTCNLKRFWLSSVVFTLLVFSRTVAAEDASSSNIQAETVASESSPDKVETGQDTKKSPQESKESKPIESQSSSSSKGTVKEALKQGIGYSSGLSSSQSSVESSAEALAKNKSLWLPQVKFSTTASAAFDQVKRPRSGGTTKPQTNDVKAAITLSQNLYSGGDTTARVAGAEASVSLQAANLSKKEVTVLLASINAYLDVVRDRKLLEINKKNVGNLEKQLEAAKIRYEVGEDTITSVAASESALEEARARKIEAEANLAASETNYIATTGEMPPATMEEAEIPKNIPLTLDDAIKIAIQQNPDVRIELAKYKAAEAEVDLAVSGLLPNLDLQVSASRDLNSYRIRNTHAPFPYQKTYTNDVTTTVSFSMPLDFNGYNQAAVREKKQAAVAQRLSFADAQNTIFGNVNGLWAKYQSYSARIRAREKQVEASGFALKQVQEEFKVGNKSYTDVLLQETRDYEARTGLVSAQRDYISVAYQLLGTIGILSIKDLNLGIAPIDASQIKEETLSHFWGIDIEESSSATEWEDPRAVQLSEINQKMNTEDYNA